MDRPILLIPCREEHRAELEEKRGPAKDVIGKWNGLKYLTSIRRKSPYSTHNSPDIFVAEVLSTTLELNVERFLMTVEPASTVKIEALAKPWACSQDYIQDLLRTGELEGGPESKEISEEAVRDFEERTALKPSNP